MTKYEHHLIITACDDGIESMNDLLSKPDNQALINRIDFTPSEAANISLYRFAAANAALRYLACNQDVASEIVSLDIALPRNTSHWFETLPKDLDERIDQKLFYGHFLCHVMHQDYIIKVGENREKVKSAILAYQDRRGALYPAEHSFGQQYNAPAATQKFYRSLDPTNTLNPGVGRMSSRKNYAN